MLNMTLNLELYAYSNLRKPWMKGNSDISRVTYAVLDQKRQGQNNYQRLKKPLYLEI